MGARLDAERKIRIGRNIRACREAAGLSQSEVARWLECSPQNINCLEAGRRGASLARLEELAAMFGVRVGDLL